MDLDEAIGKHIEWKTTLRSAIAKQASVDTATIRSDSCCDLGIWLHGEGAARHRGKAGFIRVLDTHAEFHRRAGEVADTINAKNYELAETMLDARSDFGAASIAVAAAILGLLKET